MIRAFFLLPSSIEQNSHNQTSTIFCPYPKYRSCTNRHTHRCNWKEPQNAKHSEKARSHTLKYVYILSKSARESYTACTCIFPYLTLSTLRAASQIITFTNRSACAYLRFQHRKEDNKYILISPRRVCMIF